MRVLFLNQFFPPDLAPSGRLIRELAQDLVAQGVEASVVASRSAYAGSTGRSLRREQMDGVSVYRTIGWTFGRRLGPARLLGYAAFCVGAFVRAIRLMRPDVVVIRWTPPFLPVLGLPLKRLRKVRVINWVHDLYPDYFLATGLIRPGGALHRLFDLLCMVSFHEADRIVAISEPMAVRVRAKGVPAERISVIPDWVDGKALRPIPRSENQFLERHGLGAMTVGMYAGNMGIGHEFDTLLDALARLPARKENLFLFIGDGHRKSEVRQGVSARGLKGVRFLPYVPEDELPQSLGAGDVHVITLRNGLEGIMMPNKIYGVMACARPVLYVGPCQSEVAEIVGAARCGIVVSPGDVTGVLNAWEVLNRDVALRETMGTNGRRYFEEHYDRPLATDKFCGLLRHLE